MPKQRRQNAADPQPIKPYSFPDDSRLNVPTAQAAPHLDESDIAERPVPNKQESEIVQYPRLQWNRGNMADERRTHGPLYIHDKVSAEQIANTLITGRQRHDMFAQFNSFQNPDGTPAEDPAWYPYRYQGHWTNRLIRSTAQRAMASLLYRENMAGQLDLIYMDPPYNISFQSNFQADSETLDVPETLDAVPDDTMVINAFRDTYKNGVHSYLDGLLEQLTLAHEMLAESGSFIMQIGPSNLHDIAILMAEVFGRDNHIATIPLITAFNPTSSFLPSIGNWLIWYTKNASKAKHHKLYEPINDRADLIALWGHRTFIQLPSGESRRIRQSEQDKPSSITVGSSLYSSRNCTSAHASTTGRADTYVHHPDDTPCPGPRWSTIEPSNTTSKHQGHRCNPNNCNQPYPDDWDTHFCSAPCDTQFATRLCSKGRRCGPLCTATAYLCPPNKQWMVSLRGLHNLAVQGRLSASKNIAWIVRDTDVPGKTVTSLWTSAGRVSNKQYIVETPARILERCILMTTDPGDLIMDLTCGSGAMPYQCERWGRRWIATDVSAVSIAITRERIATNTYPYHLLKDSPVGHLEEHQLEQKVLPPDLRSTVAPSAHYSEDPAKGFVNERQIRVSAATLAYGPDLNKDIIYHQDRTLKDKSKIRVASDFTVESDSRFRAISPHGTNSGEVPENNAPYENIPNPLRDRIIESILTSSIYQNGKALFKVHDIQPSDQKDITHTGTLSDGDELLHPACFYIADEDEVITRHRTNYAVHAALEVPSTTHLVIISFARETQTAQREHPRLKIYQVNAHRDLQLANLKAGETDQLFTVISEPDICLANARDNQITLTVRGLTTYNPQTRQINHQDTDRISAIMVDTDHDGDNFRVRLMNVHEVRRNQRTLRNFRAALEKAGHDIDPKHWEAMRTNTTVPFPIPQPGVKIAVKVIDRTGTEHTAVIDDPRDSRWYR